MHTARSCSAGNKLPSSTRLDPDQDLERAGRGEQNAQAPEMSCCRTALRNWRSPGYESRMRAAHPEAGYPGSTPIGRTPRAVRKVIAVTLTLTTAVACGRKVGLIARLARPQAEGVHSHPASPLSAWSSSAGNSLLLVSCRYCLSRKGGDHRDGTAMELYVHQRRHFNYLDEHQAKPALQRWR